MLDEAEVLAFEEASRAPQPAARERLRLLVGRQPGVRLLSSAPGGGAGLALEVESKDAPMWLAIADGAEQIEALRAGAAGVLPSSIEPAELAVALKAMRSGLAVMPAELLRDLVPVGNGSAAGGPALTPREIAVLQLLSEGATNKMIARRLDISVHTAKFHVASILDKLDATSRTDAVAQGVRQGVLML